MLSYQHQLQMIPKVVSFYLFATIPPLPFGGKRKYFLFT